MQPRNAPVIGALDIDSERPRRDVPPRDAGNHPRVPWLALVWGVFCAPVAFAYVGRLSWGIGQYVLFVGLLAGLGLSGLVQSAAGVWTLQGTAVALALAGIVVPWLIARRAASRDYRLKWYNRWYVYPLLAVALNYSLAYFVLNKARFFGFEIYNIPSAAMVPTLLRGERIVADMRASTVAALHPGDVAVMLSNSHAGMTIVKRIVAGPGQHVTIDADGTRVDGQLQSRAHTLGKDLMAAHIMKYSDVQLGADEFFVMGDNRSNSEDSRIDGPVPRAHLLGKVTAIYYSQDSDRLAPVE